MAIIIEKEKKGVGIIPVLVAIGVALSLFGATYFLFFAPVPGIETLSPVEAQNVTQISTIDLTLSIRDINNSPVLNVLQSHVGLPAQGSFGRENPFLPFGAAQQSVATVTTTTITTR